MGRVLVKVVNENVLYCSILVGNGKGKCQAKVCHGAKCAPHMHANALQHTCTAEKD